MNGTHGQIANRPISAAPEVTAEETRKVLARTASIATRSIPHVPTHRDTACPLR
ncbi:hypothetical protein [Rhodococcus sp. ACS1]|uniref:hypothetical protein n=1 Tax=Rhodococcus sp. ACS1 TaxID=2028570 RepID=UPI0015C97B2D|nr:hypothetical protein [Rhodococcus sp. ACS1]